MRGSAGSITQEELNKKLDEHEKWVAAGNCVPNKTTGVFDIGRPGYISDVVETPAKQLYLMRRNLSGLSLSNRNLRCANFLAATLDEASLFGSDLRGAIFTHASLRGANLSESDLRGTVFNMTDMKGVIFEPAHNPLEYKIALAVNLDHIRYDESPRAIYKLKLAFKSSGYGQAEKKVIAALNRNVLPQSSFSNLASNTLETTSFWTRKILFGFTCEFGSNAFRPLMLIFALFVVFSAIYTVSLASGNRSGLYIRFPRKIQLTDKPEFIELKIVRLSWYRRFETAIAFSLRSALRLGFQGFDFGRWVRMLQHREYDIVAIGWLRSVSAIQSLISIYLIAVAILSAFGKPFDV